MKKNNNVVIQEVTTVEKEETAREEQQQKSLVEKYADFKQAVCKAGILILYIIISLPVCICMAYNRNTNLYGDGPVNYSDEEYKIMKVTLEGAPKDENQGDVEQENLEEGNIPCLIEDIGLDIKRFREYVTDYDIHTEGRLTILRGWRTKGSFTAEITVTMDENYKVIKTERNYEDKAQYMEQFYKKLRNDSAIDGFAAWGALTAVLCFAVNTVMWIIKKFSDMRKRKMEKSIKEEKNTEGEKDTNKSEKEQTPEWISGDNEDNKSSITSITGKITNESASESAS